MKKITDPQPSLPLLTRGKNILLLMLLLPFSSLVSFNACAADLQALMQVSPTKCVAMSQGQSCYVSVELSWQVQEPGDYCVYVNNNRDAITCWKNSTAGKLTRAFTSKVNLNFVLKRESHQEAVASSVVKMAWVHKKKGQPRTSWRLF